MSDPAETLPALEVRRVSALERIADALERLTGKAPSPANVVPSETEEEKIVPTELERAAARRAARENGFHVKRRK